MHKALSDSDIRTMLGADTKILEYSKLASVGSLDELLPRLVDYCIILYEESLNIGHWVALLKYNDMFEHLHSYGIKPDNELQWINMKKRRMLKRATPLSEPPPRRREIHIQPCPVSGTRFRCEYMRVAHSESEL